MELALYRLATIYAMGSIARDQTCVKLVMLLRMVIFKANKLAKLAIRINNQMHSSSGHLSKIQGL